MMMKFYLMIVLFFIYSTNLARAGIVVNLGYSNENMTSKSKIYRVDATDVNKRDIYQNFHRALLGLSFEHQRKDNFAFGVGMEYKVDFTNKDFLDSKILNDLFYNFLFGYYINQSFNVYSKIGYAMKHMWLYDQQSIKSKFKLHGFGFGLGLSHKINSKLSIYGEFIFKSLSDRNAKKHTARTYYNIISLNAGLKIYF